MKTIFSGGIHLVSGTVLRDGRALLFAGESAALFETLEPLAVSAPAQRRDGAALVATAEGALRIGGSHRSVDLDACERFDALTTKWTRAPRLRTARSYFTAVALPDRVLVLGKGPTESLRTGAIAWELEASLPEIEGDWLTSALLANQRVLVGSTKGTWLLTHTGDTWRVERGPLRERSTLVALNDGGALVCGGLDDVQVDRLHPDGTWSRVNDLPLPRCSAVGLQLDDGSVVLAGGAGMREVSEDDSDGGQLDLEYRTVGEVHWVRKLKSLDDAVVARAVGEPWTLKYLNQEVDRGFRFGGGVLFLRTWSAEWWDGN